MAQTIDHSAMSGDYLEVVIMHLRVEGDDADHGAVIPGQAAQVVSQHLTGGGQHPGGDGVGGGNGGLKG